jgi:hypothetical protein
VEPAALGFRWARATAIALLVLEFCRKTQLLTHAARPADGTEMQIHQGRRDERALSAF